MKKTIVVMFILILSGLNLSGLILSGLTANAAAEEDLKTTEPEMISDEDQEVAEVLEMLELKEILEEMDIIKDYYLFAEEETDEKED